MVMDKINSVRVTKFLFCIPLKYFGLFYGWLSIVVYVLIIVVLLFFLLASLSDLQSKHIVVACVIFPLYLGIIIASKFFIDGINYVRL
jgi:hypothetical protein